jgi:acyl-CoA thioester hydrolase
MKDFDFQIELEVRDHECDLQGIVNNSAYQNYLEHCRHKFLQAIGMSFAQMHSDGIDAVVIRAEIDYKFPLRPGDAFLVQLKMAREGMLRIIFKQQILRKPDMKPMINAHIVTVLTRNGRPVSPAILLEKFTMAGIIFEED